MLRNSIPFQILVYFYLLPIFFGDSVCLAQESNVVLSLAKAACQKQAEGFAFEKTLAPISELAQGECLQVIQNSPETKDLFQEFYRTCSDGNLTRAVMAQRVSDPCLSLPRSMREAISQKLADCSFVPKSFKKAYGTNGDDIHYQIVPLNRPEDQKRARSVATFTFPCEPGVYDCQESRLTILKESSGILFGDNTICCSQGTFLRIENSNSKTSCSGNNASPNVTNSIRPARAQ